MDAQTLPLISKGILIGIGATALMDLWLAALKRAAIPTLDFALLGRWTGHLLHGRFAHAAIRRAEPVRGELALGWLLHYAVGIGFALMLVGALGSSWVRSPSLLPALVWGLITAAVPLFVMQPAMGAGFASSRTPAPLKNCLRSLMNHAVFGLGLYLGALALATFSRLAPTAGSLFAETLQRAAA